jgi:hypothetical protein
VVTIIPTLIAGPSFLPGGSVSAEIIKGFLDGSYKEIPYGAIGLVDVRDVSRLHFEAVRRTEAAN